jgi:hypothetical protein
MKKKVYPPELYAKEWKRGAGYRKSLIKELGWGRILGS